MLLRSAVFLGVAAASGLLTGGETDTHVPRAAGPARPPAPDPPEARPPACPRARPPPRTGWPR